jgi:hypothetical protein
MAGLSFVVASGRHPLSIAVFSIKHGGGALDPATRK